MGSVQTELQNGPLNRAVLCVSFSDLPAHTFSVPLLVVAPSSVMQNLSAQVIIQVLGYISDLRSSEVKEEIREASIFISTLVKREERNS
jgi:hypothetical protein